MTLRQPSLPAYPPARTCTSGVPNGRSPILGLEARDGLCSRKELRSTGLTSNMQNEISAAHGPGILVADDHLLIRKRVMDLLESSFDVVGLVSNGKDLLIEAERLAPDLIVLDITMPELT